MKFSEAIAALEAAGEDRAVSILTDLREANRTRSRPRKAPCSTPMSDEVREQIVRLEQTEGLATHQIAARLNINPGRVSEVLRAT